MNFNKLLSVCVALSNKACSIIRDIHDMNAKNIMYKSFANPVTEADYLIQTMIVTLIKKLWPDISIVAEETISQEQMSSVLEKYKDTVKLEEIVANARNYEQHFENTQDQPLNFDEVCLWIDPLDGTNSFVKNRLYEVSVLIGITYQNKSKAGIIGVPYLKGDNKSNIFHPKVYVGEVGTGKVLELSDKQVNTISSFDLSTYRIITSRCHSSDRLNAIKSLSQNVLESAGLGNKFISMIKGQATDLIYISRNAAFWDICAGQALIKSIGGISLDIYQKQIQYDKSSESYQLPNGIICSFNSERMERTCSLITTHNLLYQAYD